MSNSNKQAYTGGNLQFCENRLKVPSRSAEWPLRCVFVEQCCSCV